MKRLQLLCLFLTVAYYSSQGQIVQLEGLYATSTAVPFEEYSVTHLFDKDDETYWKTVKGAGPNEGIMIYFSEPTYIQRVDLSEAIGEELARLIYYEVYGDGRSFYSGESIESKLSTLYIKISRAESSTQIRSTLGDKEYSRWIFAEEKSVGISEVMLYGENDQLLNVKPPKFVKGTITASSSLSPDLAYGPSNLMDSRKDFGWAEGVSGNGIGQKLTFTTDQEITISAIKIWNGYQRSPSHYSGNARLKTFGFGKETSQLTSYEIEDSETPQVIRLDQPVTGKKFELVVNAAYSGAKYQDLVISEIKFFDGDQPVIIETSAEEQRINQNKSNNNVLLKTLIDRNINVSLVSNKEENKDGMHVLEYYYKTTSLILRSNNTFVMYERESTSVEEYDDAGDYYDSYDPDEKEVIADGNWELKEEGNDYLKIRIFGKIFSPTTSAELYQGDVTSDNVRIFQDNLTITKDKIVGERFVEEIVLKNN